MKLMKAKSQPQAAPQPGPSLADQLRAAQAAAEEYIEKVVQGLKREHTLLSVEWIAQDLRLKYGRNAVACALALLELEEKKQ
jgi:hypothetical protein